MIRYEYAKARLTDMRRIEYAMSALLMAIMPLMAKMMPNPTGMPEVAFGEPVDLCREIPGGFRRGLDLRHDEEHREEEVVEDDECPPGQPQLALGAVPQVPGDPAIAAGPGAARPGSAV